MNSNCSYSLETLNSGQNFCLVWPWNLMDVLENNRASLLCYFKLCPSFHGHPWIQTEATVWRCPIWVKIDDYFSHVTLKFDRWPGTRQSEGFDSCDRPSNLKLDSNRQFFPPCDREIWWMTLQNNKAPLLCYFKLCASFPTHWWIQTWVTIRKRWIRVKIDNFFSCVT